MKCNGKKGEKEKIRRGLRGILMLVEEVSDFKTFQAVCTEKVTFELEVRRE